MWYICISCHEEARLAALGAVGRRDGPTLARAGLRLLVWGELVVRIISHHCSISIPRTLSTFCQPV
jgi:hypothetical protein